MLPSTREELKAYCLRELGDDVLDLIISDEQVDDRIDEAIDYYQQFHYDGTEKQYMAHQITQADIDNRYVEMPANTASIVQVFPSSQSTSAVNMWDIRYQMRLQDIQSFTTGSISNYWITMTHLRMLEMELQGEEPVRFNRMTNKLYIDWDWQKDVLPNQYIIIQASAIVDPDQYTKMYSDRMLRKYATALIKRQLGTNLKKYNGGAIQLPNGITFNGQATWEEGNNEVEAIEKEFRSSYELPPMMLVG